MKKFTYAIFLISIILLAGCQSKKAKLPRVAICGIAIESSTFSPAVTPLDAFRVREGDSIFTAFPFFAKDSGIINRAEWLPTLKANAMPGGIVERAAYDSLVWRTLEMLKKSLPIDGLFFDIHGAMSVQGLEDPEGDFITKIREVIGNDVLISTSMDLHGSVSPRLAKNSDMITCYRMAPHEDSMDSKKRALVNLFNRLESGKGKPKYKAWIAVPILLPGEKTSTRVEPGKSLYAQIPSLVNDDKVIDVAIWMSYPWADESRNHGVVMAYGDDKEAVAKAAEQLAKSFWDVRNKFEFVAPTVYLPEALETALKSDKKPFIISDMGDNPTAGGAGDVTWTLTQLLNRPEFKTEKGKSLIYTSIPGKEFVEQAVKIGVGGKIDATAGAAVDNRYAPPVKIAGTITSIYKGDADAGTQVVVKSGSISVIVTEKRNAFHYEKQFTELGLKPREADILVVKIGYLVPELFDMRGDWLMALTPGGVDQDLMRLPYKHITRPMFPLDKDMPQPDLKVKFIPLANEK